MMSTNGLQLHAILLSVVVEGVGDVSIATDRTAAARQSASFYLRVPKNPVVFSLL